MIVTTDASLLGLGGVLGSISAQGRWIPKEACLSINVLELQANRLSLEHRTDLFRGSRSGSNQPVHHSGLCQPLGWQKKFGSRARGFLHSAVGGIACSGSLRCALSRRRELAGELPQLSDAESGGVIPVPGRGLSGLSTLGKPGYSASRLNRVLSHLCLSSP